MMNMLTQYVRGLAFFMVFASVVQILVPEGRFKGVISFITGLMLVLIVFKPVNKIIGADIVGFNDIELNTYEAKNEINQNVDKSGAVISAFTKSCEDTLKQTFDAEAVEIIAEYGDENVYIKSVKIFYPRSDANVKREAALMCGISETSVTVINEGADEYNETNS